MMSWPHLGNPDWFNVLAGTLGKKPFLNNHPIVAGSLLLVTAVIIFVSNAVRDPVRPRLIGFELAPSPGSALHILDKWRAPGKLRARNAILSDFLVLLFIAALISYLCFWAAITVSKQPVSTKQPWLALIGVLLGWATLVALLCGWAGNVAMLVTIARDQGTTSVFFSRFFASLKYGILAFAVAFLLCRLEYFVYQKLLWVVEYEKLQHPVTAYYATLSVLFVASVLTLLKVRKLANTLHPSLLMLQFAPSRDAANRLLARWSAKRRRAARRANWFDMLFAILYTVTLAFFFFRLKDALGAWPLLSKSAGFSEIVFKFGTWANPSSLSWCVGWFMLLAGTCQVAQDLGAWAALREGEMGWWIRICRSLGALRFALLFLGCLWVGVLVLLGETHVLMYVLCKIHITA
jgi:hypothetical protein